VKKYETKSVSKHRRFDVVCKQFDQDFIPSYFSFIVIFLCSYCLMSNLCSAVDANEDHINSGKIKKW